MTMQRRGGVQNRRRERERRRRQQRQERQRQPQTQPQRSTGNVSEAVEEAEEPALPPSPRNQVPVDSRAIRWYDYRPNQQTLYLAYVSGDVYAYKGVPESVIEDAIDGYPIVSETDFGFSWGRWVNAVIKPRYPYSKVFTAAR